MINKNQYEKSALFIKDNVPIFVRKTYLSFVNMFDELISQYTRVSENNGYSVNKVCKRIIEKRKFMYAYSFLFSHELYAQRLYEIKTNTEIRANHSLFKQDITPDEQFYTVNGPDIYAPVELISTAITPFAYSSNSLNRGSKTPLSSVNLEFEITHSAFLADGKKNYRKPEDYYSNDLGGITGIEGNPTIFDALSSGCIVDIATLFDYYFSLAIKYFDATKSADSTANVNTTRLGDTEGDRTVNEEALSLNWLIEFNKRLKSTETTDLKLTEVIIADATCYLTSAVMATYFIFAAKLRGAKNDIYSWAYTAFVKDSVSHFDKAYYPVNAPVTIASGHGVKEDYHNENSKDDPIYNTIDQNAAWDYAGGDGTNLKNVKMLIYRSIRLQYSTWASCINAIFGQAYHQDWDDGNNNTSSSFNLKNYNTENSAILKFVQQSLLEYLRARYRTYNLDTQLDLKGIPYQGISSIKSAVNAVKDISAAKAIRDSIEGYDVHDILNGTREEAMKVLSLNQTAIIDLSRVFLYGSYLYMLAGIHAHTNNIFDEIETTTGKTKEQLFEEIYYGILNTLREFISIINYADNPEMIRTDVFGQDESCLIKEASKYLTNLRPDLNQNSNWETSRDYFNDEIQELRIIRVDSNDIVPENLIKLSKSGNDKFICNNILSLIADIPLLTEFSNLKKCNFNSLKIQSTGFDCSKAIGFKENGEAFPKNKIILEAIDRFNANSKIRFKSLESLDSAVSTLESMTDLVGTEEGADAMANNSCYSAFGGIGGGICSLEITNSEDTVNDLTAEPYAATKKINNLTPTDGDDNLIPEGTSDTIDQLQLTKGTSAESAKVSMENMLKHDVFERYNKLFNKYILDIK